MSGEKLNGLSKEDLLHYFQSLPEAERERIIATYVHETALERELLATRKTIVATNAQIIQKIRNTNMEVSLSDDE